MQRLPRVILIASGLLVAYAAWPIYSALKIRDAMVAGDTATLTHSVEWDSVRASLKASMSAEALAKLEAEPDTPPPSLWQRIKSTVAPRMADSVIDRYVTPEHLPVLLGYRRIWRGTVQPVLGREEPPTVLAGTLFAGSVVDRFASFWSRLRRAVFYSPTRMEIEVEDKYQRSRRYIGTLELKGFGWKLTGLSIAGL
jgi:Protein of unknown function (DUF2939)